MEYTEDDIIEIIRKLSVRPKVEKKPVSEFIAEHKHVFYCEAIIDKDGMIGNIKPSHLISLICETGKTEDEIYEIMPVDASPIHWLVEYTGCIAIWYNGIIKPSIVTEAQRKTLKLLGNSDIVSWTWEDINKIENEIF